MKQSNSVITLVNQAMRDKILPLLFHPACCVCMILLCTLLGGVAGYYSLAYGQRGLLTTGGLAGGFIFGLGMSVIWSLLAQLYND